MDKIITIAVSQARVMVRVMAHVTALVMVRVMAQVTTLIMVHVMARVIAHMTALTMVRVIALVVLIKFRVMNLNIFKKLLFLVRHLLLLFRFFVNQDQNVTNKTNVVHLHHLVLLLDPKQSFVLKF